MPPHPDLARPDFYRRYGKRALDVWYLDHQSLRLGLRVLVRTACKVLAREGIYQPGYAAPEEFVGGGETSKC
jgi:sugar transferase EpsL